MKSIEREIREYVDGTEKMSGYDSDAEGEMSFFDDGGDSEMSFASGGGSSQSVSDPYVIQYQNTTTSDVTCYLFGYNSFFGSTNYGNPTAAVITNIQTGTTAGYGVMIAQTQNKPFKIGKWRFQSSTTSQLQITVIETHVDANGYTKTKPLNLSIMKDSYQFISDQVDMSIPSIVDGNTYYQFTLKGSATLVVTIFPVAMVTAKSRLQGGAGFAQAKAPRISGLNSSNVVIQTSQDVKSITK